MTKHAHRWRKSRDAESCACGMHRLVNCVGKVFEWHPKLVPDYNECDECGHRTLKRRADWTDTARPDFDFHAHKDTGRKGPRGRTLYRCGDCGHEREGSIFEIMVDVLHDTYSEAALSAHQRGVAKFYSALTGIHEPDIE